MEKPIKSPVASQKRNFSTQDKFSKLTFSASSDSALFGSKFPSVAESIGAVDQLVTNVSTLLSQDFNNLNLKFPTQISMKKKQIK